ncbi:MAG TPA: carboxylating nicotinate-nucleotide diphosphorylase [Balneolaceae bacterium]|nr:carboxylating nicotinate-nucleotide diphosphorylase [Balneolaceae bacterium]
MQFEKSGEKVRDVIEELVDRAFAEDIRDGDVTTDAIFDRKDRAEAVWEAKADGVIAGLGVAEKIFKRLDHDLQWQPFITDGDSVGAGAEIVSFSGCTRAILTAERTALNLVQRMSGIATKTSLFVKKIKEFDAQILDTRKTVPGLRALDKYAVRAGGGYNHRMGLFDMALIKDNHIAAAGSISKAVQKVRQSNRDLKIEVETTSLQQVGEALSAGADIIMLDNMNCKLMREAVHKIGKRAETEASGNVNLSTAAEIADTGVDYISVGGLTHSVKAFDISQKLINNRK